MKKNRTLLFASLSILSLTACQREQFEKEQDLNHSAIVLLATAEPTTTVQTRSGTTFPNAGKIAVIADLYPEDWSSLYFSDMEAVTADISPAISYGFTWSSGLEQYWPLNGARLALIAYSPKNAAIVSAGKILNVTLPTVSGNMPDLLYAQGVQYGDKTLANRNINFGQFKHALSQLTVKLVTDSVGPPITLSEFSVTTKNKATLDLLTGALVVSPSTTVKYSYGAPIVLADKTTYTLQATTSTPLLLYPDVDGSNNTTVYVKFTDGTGTGNALDLEKTLNISDFKLIDNTTSAKLERAKQIVLTITVKGTQILEIDLNGVVVPWVNMGEFGLTIE